MIQYEGKTAVLGNEIDVTPKKQAEEQVRASENQLQRLVTRLLHYREVERKSIALEIHDEIAQTLSAIKLSMESLLQAKQLSPQALSEAMMTVIGQIQEEVRLIRQVSKRLSPIMIDDLGIGSAILSLCRESSGAGNERLIETQIQVDESRIPAELKIVIYRVLEELLSLASRYGEMDRCSVSIHEGDDKITLIVQAWGWPMDQWTGENDWDLSMAVIRNRAESFGGALTLESSEQQANRITVWWPLVLSC